MKRPLLRIMIVASMFLGLAVPYVAGRDDAPKNVTLADSKTDLSRKPVSVTRMVSGGGQKRVLIVVPFVPSYSTQGLKFADAPEVYGRGVQLFYAGQVAEALARFDAAIRLDANDARSWYFKSLCETTLGDKVAAAKSIDRAVALHLQDKPPAAQIGQALERIQGPARLQFREVLDARRAR